MVICNYLPGGRLAGQVSLADSTEFALQTKMANMDITDEKSSKKYGA